MVYAATRIIDIGELRRMARFRRSELAPALATAVAVIALGVLSGIVAAIALSFADLLRRIAIIFATTHLRSELRAALTRTGWVDWVGADHLFATLPTVVAAYEQWLHDHPG